MSPRRLTRRRWPTGARLAVAGLVALLALAIFRIGADGPATPRTRPGPDVTSTGPTTTATSTSTSATAPTSGTPPSSTSATIAASTPPPNDGLPLPLPDLPAAGLLDGLAVATPSPDAPPYQRDLMDGGDWAYDPATGCNTRERVLIDEAVVAPQVDDRCRSTGGRWRSLYDGVEATDVADLQIDHLVPLADAWRAGAWRWTPEERLAFANDLTSPDTLIAVTGSTNRSKGDSTPDEWLPPDRSAWCAYAGAWVRVKARWALSVTPAEKAALAQVLAGC